MDGITGGIIYILPDRDTDTLRRYYKDQNTDDGRISVSDMRRPYYDLRFEIFRKAKHITDKYHIIRQVTRAMEAVRK